MFLCYRKLFFYVDFNEIATIYSLPFRLTTDEMGTRHGKHLTSVEVEELLSRCSFSTDKIIELHRQFVREYPNGSIDRASFMRSYEARFPHADRDFCDRLFRAHDHDDNGTGLIRHSSILFAIVHN